MTFCDSATLALNGTMALLRVKLKPLPALNVSVTEPVPWSAIVGSTEVAGRPVWVRVLLEGVGV
jgi:hypothetical protein